MIPQIQTPPKNNRQPRLTHALKAAWATRVKRLIVNRELTDFISQSIEKLPAKDKLAALYYFKKLAVQVYREPDPEHYKALKDEYDEMMSEIANEQVHFEPVKWIDAEIDYLKNSVEHLTTGDVNERLDVMQGAKLRLSKDWLSKEEVMDMFTISKSTLNRRIAEGMPCHKKGKVVHFYLQEISEWMKKEAA